MGGNALGRPARRLTTAEFEILTQHCLSRLHPFFLRTVPLKASREKTSHGDVDILCAWDEQLDPKKIRGEDWGVIEEGEDRGIGVHHPVRGFNGVKDTPEKKAERDLKEGEENKEFRRWVVEVVKAVGGDQWKRSGTSGVVISLGIPSRRIEGIDIGPVQEDEEYEPFFQVDLQLCPERYIDFTSFTRSYSNTVLCHAVSYVSPQIRLHSQYLGLHYSPYYGLEPIKLELTSSPVELCDWLGLDPKKLAEGFDNEKDLWKWSTTVREGGAIDQVWKIITDPNRVKKPSKQGKSKDEAWSRFVKWLREGDDSPYIEYWKLSAPVPKTTDQETESSTSRLSADKSSPATAAENTPVTSATVKPLSTPAAPMQAILNKNIIDPEKPAPLHHRVQALLERFGKVEEVEGLMGNRKGAAVILAERQRKKLEPSSPTPSEATTAISSVSVQTVVAGHMDKLVEQVEKIDMSVDNDWRVEQPISDSSCVVRA